MNARCLALAFPLAFVRPAAAADCAPVGGVSRCVDADQLWPHAGPSSFVAVGGASLTAPNRIGVGVIAGFQKRPIVLRLPSPDPAGADVAAVNNQLTSTFLVSYGFAKRFEASLAAPVALYQDGAGLDVLTTSQPAPGSHRALRDVRAGIAASLVDRGHSANGLALAARAELALPTGDASSFNSSGSPVFLPSLTADGIAGRFFAGAELGARMRQPVDFAGTRVGTRGLGALGIGAHLLNHNLLSLQLEAFALVDLSRQYELRRTSVGALAVAPTSSVAATSEWLASVRSAPALRGALSFQVGAGTALRLSPRDATEPGYRFILGVRYAPPADEPDTEVAHHDNGDETPAW